MVIKAISDSGKNFAELIVGDDPQVHFKVVEDNGNIFVKATSLDNGEGIGDIDAVFFNFTDPSIVGSIRVWAPDKSGTSFVDDGVNSLSDGTELIGDFDGKLEFSDDGTGVNGNIEKTAFTFWSGDRPLTLDDIDLESFAVVIDTQTSDGTVLTHNDDADIEEEMNDFIYGDWHPDGNGGWEFVGDDDDAPVEEAPKSFTISGDVNVKVTLTELDSGDMQFDLEVLEDTGSIGDLRGMFFTMEDDSLADDLSVTGDDITGSKFKDDGVDKLKGGIKIPKDIKDYFGKFDGGVAIGSKDLDAHDDDDDDDEFDDDIRTTSFVVSHDSEPLTYEDFESQAFVIDLESVGAEGGERDDDATILGQANWDEAEANQYVLGDIPDNDADEEDENADDEDTDDGGWSFWLF
jgi:hypothetical protein